MIATVAAGQLRVTGGHFLQAQHIEIPELASMGNDSIEVHAAIGTAPPLDMPGNQFHSLQKWLIRDME
jgi:hypothetical protein